MFDINMTNKAAFGANWDQMKKENKILSIIKIKRKQGQ
jgi:hypothetical protein